VFISEALLHRTRAAQVQPVYEKFITQYPSFRILADSDQEELVSMLRPLGLFWRSRMLVNAARQIVDQYDGQLPEEKNELQLLPGIGSYISSAIRCFAFGFPEVLLDTNTVRVLGRIFSEKITDSSRRSHRFRSLGARLMDREQPANFGYAMIDLAALVCVPRNPKCQVCPIANYCRYGLSHRSELRRR
jgi:A/G-specific adenine glycosylase